MYIPRLIEKHAKRRGLRKKTITTYVQCIKEFFSFYPNKDIKKITKKDVEKYLDDLLERGRSKSTLNVHLCSLKFLFTSILNKKLLINVRFSRTPKKIPVVLSKFEVIRLLDAIDNPKHNLMISLMYSAGLRVSELVNLKKRNIDFSRNCGWVRDGKGGKDRPFLIAQKLNQRLFNYISENCKSEDDFLFNGRYGAIRVSTIQKIVKDASKVAGLKKNVHTHTLRHSFSTHLIENGFNLYSVQNLLGHESPETTMMYVHVANTNLFSVISPFDTL